MNKITFTLSFVLFVVISSFGQQEVQYTQFMENKLMLNPAYAGARDATSIMVLNRNQWIGFEGAPNSQLMSLNAPVFGDRVGLGLSVSHHSIGVTQNWIANMAYSYKIPLSNDAAMRVGVQGSMRSWQFDLSNISTTDPTFLDGAIPVNQNSSSLKGNFGAGLYFNTKKVYLGISAPFLLSNQIGFNQNGTAESAQHFYVMAGTAFDLTDKLMLKPSVLGKYVKNAPLDVDANLSLVYMYKFTFGLSYRVGGGVLNGTPTVSTRNGESVALVTGFQINKQMNLGLSYDFLLSDINTGSKAGSLEVLLRYDFRGDDVNLSNPRFFF